jgi:putative heme-binding domain-containing protein
LDYLLENIVDPSAIVGADFRLSLISLKDGRVLNGIIGGKTEKTFTVQMLTERAAVDRSDVLKIEDSIVSLMPEGLLEGMDSSQIADLISYLMTPQQVPLPAPQSK